MTERSSELRLPDVLSAHMDRRTLIRYTMVGAASASFATLLAACGDDDDEPAVEPDAPEPVDEDEDEETPEPDEDEPTEEPEPDDDDEAPADPMDESWVRIAQGVDIATFDPHEDTSSSGMAILQNIFDHLLMRDDSLELTPSIAEQWENVDELTWEFQIRQGVMFHDGSELTVDDIVFTFEHVLDPDVGSRQRTRIVMIESVEAADDTTLRITTSFPFPPLLTVLQYVFIMPAEIYSPDEFALNPVGSGPYRFVEWIRDDHVYLERFDDHWRGPAPIQSVEFRPIVEGSTRVAALRTREIDIAALVPVTDVPEIDAAPDVEIRDVQSLRTIFVGMNTWNAPLDDPRVRQALNYGVNVEEIIEFLLDGFGFPLASVTGPAEFGYNPNLETYPYDPDRARELLAEAGYPDGFDITLDTPTGRYLQDVEVSQAIAGQLADIGVNVEVRPAEFQEYFDRWLASEIEGLYFLGFGASTLDADGVMGSHFDSERRGLYYNSPESDELIHAAMREFDEEAREAIYHELMEYFHEQAPWIFLYTQQDIYGVASDLDWAPRADERLWVYDMQWT
jgi:peptide/nickel transport system substrate-binding protein